MLDPNRFRYSFLFESDDPQIEERQPRDGNGLWFTAGESSEWNGLYEFSFGTNNPELGGLAAAMSGFWSTPILIDVSVG